MLIEGYQESGESMLFLITLDNRFNFLDEIILSTFEETEEGGEFTKFKINDNYIISIIKEKNKIGKEKVIVIKDYKITEKGEILEI